MDVSEFINLDEGLISRRIYVEQDIYNEEAQKVFFQSWLYLTHESQIPNAGDFVTTRMGEEPVLVWRDSAGKVNAFLNTCLHSDSRLCRAEEGNAESFTCFHGWTYANDGSVIAGPGWEPSPGEKPEYGPAILLAVAQIESYRGLVFATFNPKASSLREYLGNFTVYLDAFLGPEETEVIGGTHKWVIPCNWKFAAENFAGDNAQLDLSHVDTAILTSESFGKSADEGYTITTEGGHGVSILMKESDRPLPAGAEFEENISAEMAKHLDPLGAMGAFPITGNIFPNFSFGGSDFARSIRVWHPHGPGEVEVFAWCLVDKNAPADIRDATRKAIVRFISGPAALSEQDRSEIWQDSTIASRGVVAKRFPFNYQMGLGHDRFHEELPGTLGKLRSETNQRGFYKRWSELMQSELPEELR